ncbi:hypothetical protein NM688_g1454 [Phlebia brevispora]|uniref:Uncharacterized protein n=1 Tax=Phlebia brevispora TaxID=194682 RepID=A0ACC1TBH0_9APHY|nr:hypothetical protein NM688_g1454 [Phlebia brevispora]
MSCCGESANQANPQAGNRSIAIDTAKIVAQQPSPQPTLQLQEKSSFQPPSIATPPPVLQYHQNAVAQSWPPQAAQMHSYATGLGRTPSPPTGTPTLVNGSLNGHGSPAPSIPPLGQSYSPPLTHPSAVYSPSATMTVTPKRTVSPGGQAFAPSNDEGKLSVSIDFGTTFSGVAYGSSRIAAGKVQQILNWPGSFETFRKIPTCLLYDASGQIIAWGLEAKNASPLPGATKCEWFKLFLEPSALRDENAVDPRLPSLPPGKNAIDVIVDFLACLWDYAQQQITREIGAVADLDTADVWLTVPAAWDARGCQIMRDAAIRAGLVRSAHAGDATWRDRLRIITEPEAAAVHCAYLTDLHKLRPSQNFMICDAGGGTVVRITPLENQRAAELSPLCPPPQDLAVYKIIGMLSHLEIAEMCARSGANCGSIFLDLRFRELVKTLLAEHPVHLDAASLAYFMHNFSDEAKMAYKGLEDDNKIFHFTCFNVEDPDDPSVGLRNGDLTIPGNLLRQEVFDPVVHQVLELIEEQTKRIDQTLQALLLVGGFSGSEYLFQKVKERFGSQISVIARPADCDAATLRGAAQYGLARRPLVSSVVAPQSYMLQVKLPAEQEDELKRPAYIQTNNAAADFAVHRLQYLVAKGAILRKGQRVTQKFCKFIQSGQDRMFVATLYSSESDKIMRYTDEVGIGFQRHGHVGEVTASLRQGETMELCKWTVDLSVLPSFQQHAASPHPNGFYCAFELGLELDSAEVRGLLVHEGQDWGYVVVDIRT